MNHARIVFELVRDSHYVFMPFIHNSELECLNIPAFNRQQGTSGLTIHPEQISI